MPKRNWLHHYPIGIGLAALLLWVGFLYYHYHQPQDAYCGTPEQCQSSQQSQKVAPNITGAKRGVADAGAEPPVTDPKTYRDERRAEGDLEAQRQMARWAFWQLSVTGVGIVLTGVGIFYLAYTVFLTRRALDEAGKSSQAAVLMAKAMIGTELPIITPRWIGVELVQLSAPFVEGVGPYGGAVHDQGAAEHSYIPRVPLRNFGRTPAFLTSISLGFDVADRLPEPPTFARTVVLEADTIVRVEPQEEPEYLTVDFGIELGSDQLQAIREGSKELWVFFALVYRDFMHEPHTDVFCARYARRHGKGSPYYFASDGDPPAAYTKRSKPDVANANGLPTP